MMKFEEIIQRGVQRWKDTHRDSAADETQCFRGSNTPLLFKHDFVCDSASHCPRIAMMRRAKMPTDLPKTLKDWNSHSYGRAMEELLKKYIIDAEVEGLTTREEEDYKVQLSSSEGGVIYSARPDLIMIEKEKPEIACEFKSVQSNSTGESVFVLNTPKLGACIQVAAQMHFHDIKQGVIAYMLGHWIDGYSFSSKSKFKLEPSLKVFHCKFDDEGWLTVGNKTTIVNRNSIENGIALLNDHWEARTMPLDRPKGYKTFGDVMGYNVCDYCIYGKRNTNICEQAESYEDGLKLDNFMDVVRERLAK